MVIETSDEIVEKMKDISIHISLVFADHDLEVERLSNQTRGRFKH